MIIGNNENLVRFNWVKVFEPEENMSGVMKYSIQIMVPKKSPIAAELLKIKTDMIAKGIAEKKFTAGQTKLANFKEGIRDGDLEAGAAEDGSKDYMKGYWFFNASSGEKYPPTILNRFGKPILDSNEVYSGCWGLADVQFFCYNRDGGIGIACGLNSIMKKKDDERLDGRVAAEKVFAEMVDSPDSEEEEDSMQ